MRLHLPELLRHLKGRPMFVLNEQALVLLPPHEPGRRAAFTQFRPMLHQAGKFIFDSGQDVDPETTQAIKDTAQAMLEDGRFHLPYPITWIEDPFEDDPLGLHRNYYLAVEKNDRIKVWTATRARQHFALCALPMIINLNDEFLGHHVPVDFPPGHPNHNPHAYQGAAKLSGETDYTIRKFIVTLGSGGIERDEVPAERDVRQRKEGGGSNEDRRYPFTVIRVPAEPLADGSIPSMGMRHRRHFVRGYVWGKNTKPREEQRRIAGYYRGLAELGQAERTHYEVRA